MWKSSSPDGGNVFLKCFIQFASGNVRQHLKNMSHRVITNLYVLFSIPLFIKTFLRAKTKS